MFSHSFLFCASMLRRVYRTFPNSRKLTIPTMTANKSIDISTDVRPTRAALWPRHATETIAGTQIYLTPLQEHHAETLFPHVGGESNAHLWAYMHHGPFYSIENFRSYIKNCVNSTELSFWAVVDRKSDQILGHSSFLRADYSNAVVEIGNIMYSPILQRTLGSTEAWYLLADRAFACGFRRLEWKCNALNKPSKRAALRFGHESEGIFRQHMIVKGKNRDTAWYSIIDSEWPAIKRSLEAWRDPANFDEAGGQKLGLVTIRESTR
jgi:RimJ/RimL family protein N-acetyltransferase